MRPVRQRRLRLTIGYPGTACAGSVEEVGAGSRIRTYEARSAADLQSAAINHSAIPAFWTRRSAASRSSDWDGSLGCFALAPVWMRRSTALQPILSDCCSTALRSLLVCLFGSFSLEPERGLEPLTYRLQIGCAANCATRARASPHRGSHKNDPPKRTVYQYAGSNAKREESAILELDGGISRRSTPPLYFEITSHSHWPAKMPAPIAASWTNSQYSERDRFMACLQGVCALRGRILRR
jgi:hypothetical protein